MRASHGIRIVVACLAILWMTAARPPDAAGGVGVVPQSGVDAVLDEYLDAYTSGDIDRLAGMLAADAVFEDSVMELTGRASVRQGLTLAFQTMEILDFSVDRRIDSGPRQVLLIGSVRFRQQGAPDAPWLEFDIPMALALKVDRGLVVRHVDYVDTVAYAEQYRAQSSSPDAGRPGPGPGPARTVLPDPDDPQHAFDFMLGEWRTTGQLTGDDRPGRGVLTVERLFDGAGALGVVMDNELLPVEDPADNAFGLTGFEAARLFVFHPDVGVWRGIGHNSLANRKWIDVTVGDGELVLDHGGELFGEVPGTTRFVYHDITDRSFSMRVDYSADGETWQHGTYRMTAERLTPAR